MREVLLPFHVSGPFAEFAPPSARGKVFGKIAASANGKYTAAQVRFKITQDEAEMLLGAAKEIMASLNQKNDDELKRYRLTKTVAKNATRALEMFEERKPKVVPFLVVPNSDEKLARIQKMTNISYYML